MPGTAVTTPLMQELAAAHSLALQCAEHASRLLDSAAAPGWNERAGREALRMGGLATRLMEGVGQLVPRLRGRLTLGPLEAVCAAVEAARPAAPATASTSKLHAAPGTRRGRLKNGNPAGDYLKSPRCGARTRTGCSCRQPAMPNGRCRLHGGLSTGPRTPAGLARCRSTRLTHGYRSRELIGLRRRAAHAARRLRNLTYALSAGHGVHRSNPALTCGRSVAKINHRGHRDHRGVLPPSARVARNHPSSVLSVSSVVNLSSAGHGLHRPFSKPEPIGVHLRSSAAKSASPAGHGVHPPSRSPLRRAKEGRSFRDHLRASALTLTLAQRSVPADPSMFATG